MMGGPMMRPMFMQPAMLPVGAPGQPMRMQMPPAGGMQRPPTMQMPMMMQRAPMMGVPRPMQVAPQQMGGATAIVQSGNN